MGVDLFPHIQNPVRLAWIASEGQRFTADPVDPGNHLFPRRHRFQQFKSPQILESLQKHQLRMDGTGRPSAPGYTKKASPEGKASSASVV